MPFWPTIRRSFPRSSSSPPSAWCSRMRLPTCCTSCSIRESGRREDGYRNRFGAPHVPPPRTALAGFETAPEVPAAASSEPNCARRVDHRPPVPRVRSRGPRPGGTVSVAARPGLERPPGPVLASPPWDRQVGLRHLHDPGIWQPNLAVGGVLL